MEEKEKEKLSGRSMMRQSETLRKPAAGQMTGTSSDLMAENI